MKQLSVLIKPASSLCNMRCKYCFYADVSSARQVPSYGIMAAETAKKMIDTIYKDLEAGDELTIAFQGGEPTLVGLSWYEKFVEYVAKKQGGITVHYALQTNGLVINDEWCKFLKQHKFLLGLSLDGPAPFHNQNRLTVEQKGSFAQIMATKRLFDKHKIEYNIMCVLTNEIARYPAKMWKFIVQEDIRYIQFIPCMEDLNKKGAAYALKPERFASFYMQLLSFWVRALENNQYYSVKFFDSVINLLAKNQITACGISGQCQAQYVIEADGSVYPCDFYVLDEYNLGNIKETRLKNLWAHPKMQEFLLTKEKPPLICTTCAFASFCGGGCKRMKNTIYLTKDDTVCGYQQFLHASINTLQNIASGLNLP